MRVSETKVEERMAQNPGMDYLTAYRAEQSRALLVQKFNSDRAHRERIYAKW